MQLVLNHRVPAASIDFLIEASNNCIDQCCAVLSGITDTVYRQNVSGSSSIGTHVRHIIERFNCLLLGLEVGEVNYDQRQREKELELDLVLASRSLVLIKHKQSRLNMANFGALAITETVNQDCAPVTVSSTLERELLGLVSHTTHHLAIIAMLIKAQGFSVDSNVGKAASTILYERDRGIQ